MSKIYISKAEMGNVQGLRILVDDSGAVIRVREDDPTAGFIVLVQTSSETVALLTSTRLQTKTRTTLYAGSVRDLDVKIKEWETRGSIPGKIIVKDLLESELPETLKNPDNYIKRAGQDGPVLMKGGERIYSFKLYYEGGDHFDQKIEHDNKADVISHRKATRLATADLES